MARDYIQCMRSNFHEKNLLKLLKDSQEPINPEFERIMEKQDRSEFLTKLGAKKRGTRIAKNERMMH
jgi:hypothetical protein